MFVLHSAALTAIALVPSVYGYGVTLDKGLIQNFHSDLPVFNLGTPVVLGDAVIQKAVHTVAPDAKYKGGKGPVANKGDQTVAYVDPKTGVTAVFPQSDALVGGHIDTSGSGAYFNDPTFFPKDGTVVKSAAGPDLVGRTHYKDGTNSNSTDPVTLISHVVAQRSVVIDDKGTTLPVRGVGSKAVFGFGTTGLASLTYSWHPATKGSTVSPVPVDEVHDAIVDQLKGATAVAPYTVTGVEAVYYDSGEQHLQPAFYFVASRDANKTAAAGGVDAPAKLSGYVPVGKAALEPLPDLTVSKGDKTPPANPPPAGHPPALAKKDKDGFVAKALGNVKRTLPTVTVGRYVVRNDDPNWVASANGFWNALSAWNGVYAYFVNAQYYWAYPWEYEANKEQYIDSVNFALTESHGNWDLFTTYQNWGDVVYLSQIPGGYGPAGGGNLAYWAIHSCEVIPSEADYPSAPLTSFNQWWHIFQGLHAIVGYRTEMYIADGATTPFGGWIGEGVPVVTAWLSAVHGDSAFYGSNPTYFDGNRQMTEPLGRASTIYVCGHLNDVVWNTANLGAATCLTETWYNN